MSGPTPCVCDLEREEVCQSECVLSLISRMMVSVSLLDSVYERVRMSERTLQSVFVK